MLRPWFFFYWMQWKVTPRITIAVVLQSSKYGTIALPLHWTLVKYLFLMQAPALFVTAVAAVATLPFSCSIGARNYELR